MRFPRVQLSSEDAHALTSLAHVVVQDDCQQRQELYEVHKGVVGKRHWKKLHQHERVAVYMQTRNGVMIDASAGMRLSTLPGLMVVGSIQGRMEDLLYAISNNSLDSMRIKSSYIHDGLVDFAVLASLAQPSREDPFRSLQLKWTVKGRQAFTWPFVRFRDSVFLESLGTTTTDAGEHIGYFLRHSVQVDDLRELTDLDIVRGQISMCSIYRQRDADTVDVFTTSFVYPMGKINPDLAAKAIAVSLCSIGRLAHCARMKKLMSLLKTSG